MTRDKFDAIRSINVRIGRAVARESGESRHIFNPAACDRWPEVWVSQLAQFRNQAAACVSLRAARSMGTAALRLLRLKKPFRKHAHVARHNNSPSSHRTTTH